jgi:WD40 repeat protein
MKSSTTLSPSLHAGKFVVTVITIEIAAVLSFAAENPQPLSDRYGDSLPPGAIRRFGTLRFRHLGTSALAFTPDGKQLIVGGRGIPLVVFDAATGRKLRELGIDKPQSRDLMGFDLSSDGKYVAGCGSDVFVWDLATARLIRQFFFNDRYQEVAFSPNGTRVAALKKLQHREDEEIRIVIGEMATGKHAEDWLIHKGKPLSFSIGGLTCSPNGKYLALRFSELREERPFVHSAASSQVWLLDAATGKRVRTIGSASVHVACFAFQPGSGHLATYGKDGILRFWDMGTEKEVRHFQVADKGEENGFGELRFSADGGRCAVPTNRARYLTVLDTKDGRIVRRIDQEESSYWVAIALSGDGSTLASSGLIFESCVRVWDIASGVERLADVGYREPPIALSLSPDGRTLISRDQRGHEIHWDRHAETRGSRKGVARAELGDMTWSGDFSHKTLRGPRWRVVYKNQRPGLMEVWSLDGTKLIRKLEIHSHNVPTVAVSPDGGQLAITQNPVVANYTIMLWDPEREEKPRVFPGSPDVCWELLFSHNGKRLIAASGFYQGNNSHTGVLWIWDTTKMRFVRKLSPEGIPSHLRFTADDRVLLAGIRWQDASVRAWDMETGKELVRMADPALKPPSENTNWRTQAAITGLALSADERFLAVVSSWGEVSAVSIWETGTWKLIRAFPPFSPRNNNVKAMVFSRDGRSLFAANDDSTILEWDVSGRFGHKGETPNRDRLNNLWRSLAETPDKAYPAVWEMLEHPSQSVPFLKDKIPPIQPVDEKRVRELLARLDADSFAEREEASRQLLALGDQFLPMLRQALEDHPTLEMRKRLESILETLGRGPSREQLRLLRALAVLEWSDSAESGEHLRRLAEGTPQAALTKAARAAWKRRQR